MVHYKLVFAAGFLPIAMLLYQIIPKKVRWFVLLLASLCFYSTFSVRRMWFPFAAAAITWGIGLWLGALDAKQKEKLAELKTKKAEGSISADEVKTLRGQINKRSVKSKRATMILGILLLLWLLLSVKYADFALENVNWILRKLGVEKQAAMRNLILPLGISFYTLQAIGYLVDVYWNKITPQKNPLKVLLFLSFFPTIIQGPIAAYEQIHTSLFAGESIDPDNVICGYLRLGWGVFKKLVIADRMYPAVCWLYYKPNEVSGIEVIAAAVMFTVMEYMDFSGCIDMAIGCGQIFGITLPENFKQPFLAKNASEFWRRWHISLGVWFKTYIFYPVSMSTLARNWAKFAKEKKIAIHPTKMVASAMALLPVWLCNGLWHGPKWTYIFYGVFYFVVILLELIFEPLGNKILEKCHLSIQSKGVTVFRVVKTWGVIFLGELFFEANTVSDGFAMLGRLFSGFGASILSGARISQWGMDASDWVIVMVGLLIVGIINHYREKGVQIPDLLLQKPLALRWVAALSLILVIMIFGLYGPGYQEVDMIYAGF